VVQKVDLLMAVGGWCFCRWVMGGAGGWWLVVGFPNC